MKVHFCACIEKGMREIRDTWTRKGSAQKKTENWISKRKRRQPTDGRKRGFRNHGRSSKKAGGGLKKRAHSEKKSTKKNGA